MTKQQHLKRALGTWELSLYGIGVILGAGIYALIGVGAGIAGNAIWLAFAIAAAIAACTGLSYAELSSLYPKEAAEYNYTKYALHKKYLSFLVGWLMVLGSIIGAVTVAFGFAGYFTHIVGGSVAVVAVVLLLVLSVINYAGIKESSKFNIVSTIIETLGLFIVIGVGAYLFFSSGVQVDLLETPGGGFSIVPVLSAVALIFFAYLGFEDIVNVSEETKRARKTVPTALVIAIVVSTLLYILVSLSAVNVLGWERLSQSKAPLTEAVSSVVPNSGVLFSLIALFATANTALILLIVGSRILYGMARDHSLPKAFSKVNGRGTPGFSVGIIAGGAVLAAFIGNIKTVAAVTDISLFLVYLAVNVSLIVLRYRLPQKKRLFQTPLNIGKFPVLAFLGAATSVFMLFYFERKIVLIELALIAVGIVLYLVIKNGNLKKQKNKPSMHLCQ